jgi:hypothetical protein
VFTQGRARFGRIDRLLICRSRYLAWAATLYAEKAAEFRRSLDV